MNHPFTATSDASASSECSQGYVAFVSHFQQLEWFAILAGILRDRFGIRSVALCVGDRDAQQARKFREYDQVIDLMAETDSGPKFQDENDAIEYLEQLESTLNETVVISDILMDRHIARAEWNMRDAALYLAKILASVKHHIEVLGAPVFSFSETNTAHYRLIQRVINRPFYIPHAVAHQDRFYFESTMWAQWPEFQLAFNDLACAQLDSPCDQEAEKEFDLFIGKDGNTTDFYSEFKNSTVGSLRKKLSIINIFSHIRKDITRVFDFESSRDPRYLSFYRDNIFLSLARNALIALKKNQLRRRELKVLPDRYCTYFLHMQPEITVEGLAFDFRNQIDLCVTIASRLPVGVTLLVKEHYWMDAQRPWADYHKLLSCPNIELISNRISAHTIIKNSMGVFSLTGTCALEAAMFGVPSFIFGEIYFKNCPGVTHIPSYQYLTKKMADLFSPTARESLVVGRSGALRIWTALTKASHAGLLGSQYSLDDMRSPENKLKVGNALEALLEGCS